MSKAAFLIATSAFFLDGATATFNTRGHRTFVQDILLGNPFFFFFFFFFVCVFSSDTFWTLELDHPPSSLSCSISPIWSRHPHPPSLIKNPRLTLHLRSQTSPHPPSPIKNSRLTLHLRSQPSLSISPISTLASPSIDDLTLTLTFHLLSHPHPPFPISTLTSHSISDLHRHPPR